jgi:hypothetical protein
MLPIHLERVAKHVMERSSKVVSAGHPLSTPENSQRPSAVCTKDAKKSDWRTGRRARRGCGSIHRAVISIATLFEAVGEWVRSAFQFLRVVVCAKRVHTMVCVIKGVGVLCAACLLP